MGLILGRFRKKKSTLDQLEKIDTDIKSIEAFRLNTELAQRKIVGHFILVSAGIYILIAVVFYFYFFPATLKDQIFYITPLLLVPFIIWGVKRLLTWYYRRKISRNESKLSTLRSEKKKLLEQVMDTETYKVAKTILEKYAPEHIKKSTPSYEITPLVKPNILTTPNTVRSRPSYTKSGPNTPNYTLNKTPPNLTVARNRAMSTPLASEPFQPLSNKNGNNQHEIFPPPMIRQGSTPIPLPREIFPRDRSVLDKMVEYLVGDGPGNRYALICKNCQSHNGMALREEFEYFAFRCCYCFTFNPARKQRPAAPKLEYDISIRRRNSDDSTSSSEKNSNTDTDEEKEKKTNRQKQIELQSTEFENKLTLENKEAMGDHVSDQKIENTNNDNVPMEVDEMEEITEDQKKND